MKIYIFKTGHSAYKIGVSSNVDRRRHEVQTGCPTKVEVFKVYELERAHEVETVIHNYFADFSMEREWFEIPEATMAAILAEIEAIIHAAIAGDDLGRWIKEDNDTLRRFRDSLREQKFSEQTVRSYVWVRKFLNFHQGKSCDEFTLADLDSFLNSFSNRAPNSQRGKGSNDAFLRTRPEDCCEDSCQKVCRY